jgi:hypothetical protein
MPNDTEGTNKNTEATDQNTKSTKENIKSKKELKSVLDDLFESKEKSIDQQIREIQYTADLARMQGDQLELQDQLAKSHKLLIELGEESEAMNEEQRAAFQAEKEAREGLVKSIAKQMGMNDEQIKGLLEATEAIEGVTESTKKYAKASDNLFEGIRGHVGFLFGDNKTGLVGGMFEFAAAMNSAEGGLGTFGKSFAKTFNFTTFATAMVNNFVESTIGMIKSFDDAAASFAAATGTGDEFTGTMLEMRQEGNALGVTFENSSKALQSLVENHVGFLNASKTAQKEMATQVALMDRIGISTDTSAEMLNVFTINMGKSQGAAIQMTKSLISMGGVLGNSQKFLQNFQESLQSLAVYGEGAVDVFSNMAAAARAAGVEVKTLTGLAAKFDTFAEAAETVGKLNTLLGSQMSSTEMLLMTEDQRIETLIQQVQISGEAFADMNKFKQMAIANAAGISDMNEAQRIFGMNMKEYKTYQKDMERQAKIQDNFNKAIDATIPLTEKFSQFMAEFAIFVQPLADIASIVLGFMTDLMASMGETEKTILLVVSAVGLAYVAFSGLGATLPLIGAAAGVVSAGVGSITAAATAGGPAMVGLGSAAGGAAIGMGAFALPVIGIGLALTGVVLSLGYLIGQFVELAKVGPDAVMLMVSFAAALTALSFAGAGALFGSGGLFLSMAALTTSLIAIEAIIGNNTSAISNALENLALIATGTSAKVMGGQTATITSELKGAVEALTTTKIDIKLSIDDGKLYDIMKGAVAEVISKDGRTQQQIVTLARGA